MNKFKVAHYRKSPEEVANFVAEMCEHTQSVEALSDVQLVECLREEITNDLAMNTRDFCLISDAEDRLLELARLRQLIGNPPEGSHTDEWKPRAETWHQERLNWQVQLDHLRAELAYVKLQRDALLEITWLDLPDEPTESIAKWRELFGKGWVRRELHDDNSTAPTKESQPCQS